MKLYVKHRWWSALLALLLAIAISYIATKGLELQRRRAAQLEKVDGLRPAWLREEPAPLPAVAARALLRQVEDRNQKLRDAILGQDLNKAHIEKAELLLRVLKRVRRIQSRIKSAPWDLMVTNRANKRLAALVAALDAETVNEDKVRQMEAELGVFEQWFDPAQFDALYWAALKSDMEVLMAKVRPDTFAQQYQARIKGLHQDVETALSQPPSGKALYQIEQTYAKVKILWERHQESDEDALQKLNDALKEDPGMRIEQFFRIADRAAWSKLQDAEFELIAPEENKIDPLHAYELIRFEIAPKDPMRGRNYLFKHGVEYVWSLHFTRKGKGGRKPLAQRRTMEPRVVHYCPDEGEVDVSVTLRYDDKSSEAIALGSRQIQQSRDHKWRSAFRFSEFTALGIATVFAAISGMTTYYFGKPAFGSIGDYIALFIWGAGVDQAKNFIQTLDKTSGKG